MTTPGYLHRCLEVFAPAIEARFEWKPDYAGLEAALRPVGEGRRELAFADIELIQNGRFWDFRQFWRFPGPQEISRELDLPAISSLLARLPRDEEPTILRLHAAFKYIENVSVILRFIHPIHYGILSPPVEKVLEVRRGRNDAETYLNYLRDLREVRDHYGLARAADADMALWVVQEIVLSSWQEPDLRRAWREDSWMLRRRAVNLLAELGDVIEPLLLARALVGAHTRLAGALAAFEFERRLRASDGANLGDPGIEKASRIREALLVGRGRGERPGAAQVLTLIETAESLGDPDTGGND